MLLLAQANAFKIPLPDNSLHFAVSSPPYYSLRKYAGEQEFIFGGDENCVHEWGIADKPTTKLFRDGNTETIKNPKVAASVVPGRSALCYKCNAWRGAYGLEPTLQMYVDHTVEWCREVYRVLRDDGTFWLNLGDSYNSQGGHTKPESDGRANRVERQKMKGARENTLKPKDLMGVPWRVALALQADGWYLRSDIIWCLSGGAKLYAQTQRGEGPHLLKDLARLDPKTVRLWNGEKWTQVLGWSESPRPSRPLEVVLRSGERIGCTPDHQFPTDRGLLKAKDIQVGDVLNSCLLPETYMLEMPKFIPDDIGWFIGLYIAEGSKSGTTMQIACHVDEVHRFARVFETAQNYGGNARWYTLEGNSATIHIDCGALLSILDMYVSGRTAKNKRLSPKAWQRSNAFFGHVLNGYLAGDGHQDGNRWRLGFTRNYEWEQDLRTICAKLGYQLRLKPAFSKIGEDKYPSFRGEIRFETSDHFNVKSDYEVIEIRNSRARKFYDVGVEDKPHLFALASGVLTHNSKPNPMPESVTDRPTKTHEYLFLLTKSDKYYYDADAIREPVKLISKQRAMRGTSANNKYAPGVEKPPGVHANTMSQPREYRGYGDMEGAIERGETPLNPAGRNKRTVWKIATAPYKGAHFATFPPALVEPCIKAGTSEHGVCPECGNPWERVTQKSGASHEGKTESHYKMNSNANRIALLRQAAREKGSEYSSASLTLGWRPTCDHYDDAYRAFPRVRSARKQYQQDAQDEWFKRARKRPLELLQSHGLYPIPATVLDPFVGSGTTLMVARKLGRHGIGLDVSSDYLKLASIRLGLKALQSWESGHGISGNEGEDLQLLPLWSEKEPQ